MRTITTHFQAALLAAAVLMPVSAGAMPLAIPMAPPSQVVRVAGDCRAIGQQIAAQNGGVLADAHVEQRGGRSVCVGVVIVEGGNGERGRRIPFEQPM
jgi:hypothetical protein